jgi:hypothetical protein
LFIPFLRGHKQLQTALVYLDVTIEQKAEAMEKQQSLTGEFCGVKPIKR